VRYVKSWKKILAQMARVRRCLASVLLPAALGAVLAGCASGFSPAEQFAGVEPPPPQTEVPQDFPNVYTDIARDDVLKTEAEKRAAIETLEEARGNHVDSKTGAIVNR